MEKETDRHSELMVLYRRLRLVSLQAMKHLGPRCAGCAWGKRVGNNKVTCFWRECRRGKEKPRRSGVGVSQINS